MQRVLAVMLLGLCLCTGCNDSGAPLHFVLPDGFKGEIRIVKDPDQGSSVREEGGRFTYIIPPDGQLRVRSLAPFSHWHKESAVFQNGGALKTGTDDNVPEDSVALRSLGTLVSDGVTTVRYYVGTKKDEATFR